MSDIAQAHSVTVIIDRAFIDNVNESFVQRVAMAVLDQEGPLDPSELGIRITGDAGIRELNDKYRDVDAPTDVLSFASDDDSDGFILSGESPEQLGDVAVSYPTAVAQAKEYGHSIDRELGWLLVHGILQLLGYSHYSPAEAQLMRGREELVLKTLGLSGQEDSIKDPYA